MVNTRAATDVYREAASLFSFTLNFANDQHTTMSLFNLLGNIIWLIFGGLFCAIGYVVGGLVLCCTIIGIPFGLQCFKLAGVVLWPFGTVIRSSSSSTGCLSFVFNIIWLFCGGFWTATSHLIFGII